LRSACAKPRHVCESTRAYDRALTEIVASFERKPEAAAGRTVSTLAIDIAKMLLTENPRARRGRHRRNPYRE